MLARKGKFKEAETTLIPNGTPPAELVLLHAQAALVTSSGDYSRALELWRSLLDRDPQNAEAQRMITSIELWLSRPAWMRFAPLAAASAGALIFFLGLWWALSDSAPIPAGRKPVAPAASHAPIAPAH